ncbi:Uma2 family endonuclease [Salinibacter ruber]|uniref:Uma2 family endonuclease n=1 Tax=Salinibacter ruber TaxID=146919 RepID=UPI002166EDCF
MLSPRSSKAETDSVSCPVRPFSRSTRYYNACLIGERPASVVRLKTPRRAPDLCVEVMSESNDWSEMDEKRALYLEAGAEEVWVVDKDGAVRFFRKQQLEASELVPGFPERV